MPEDCLIGFDFKADTKFDRDAAQQVAGEVTRLQHVRKDSGEAHLDYLKAADESAQMPCADWADNVPPDFTDSFDFVLM